MSARIPPLIYYGDEGRDVGLLTEVRPHPEGLSMRKQAELGEDYRWYARAATEVLWAVVN